MSAAAKDWPAARWNSTTAPFDYNIDLRSQVGLSFITATDGKVHRFRLNVDQVKQLRESITLALAGEGSIPETQQQANVSEAKT